MFCTRCYAGLRESSLAIGSGRRRNIIQRRHGARHPLFHRGGVVFSLWHDAAAAPSGAAQAASLVRVGNKLALGGPHIEAGSVWIARFVCHCMAPISR